MYASMQHDKYQRKTWTWTAKASHDAFGSNSDAPVYHMWTLDVIERERASDGSDNCFRFACRDLDDLLQLEEAIRAAILDLQIKEGVVQEVDLGTVGKAVKQSTRTHKTHKEVTA